MLYRAGWSHFARHYFGNLGWFLFLQLLRCFSSPRSLCIPMYSVCNDLKGRVSPFGNLRIKARLLAPRSLSQATTSFIACNRQGIHHVHLFTCPYNVGLFMSQRERYRQMTAYFVCWYIQITTLSVHDIFRCDERLKKTLLLPDC